MTGYYDKKWYYFNSKVEKKIQNTDSDDVSYIMPFGIILSFSGFHLPLSQQATDFQLFVNSGLSKHFINPDLIGGVESSTLDQRFPSN